MPSHRIIVLARANAGSMMSSPGIRALNIARVLARALPASEIVLALPGPTDLVPDAPFSVVTYSSRTLVPLLRGCDIVVAQSFPTPALPAIAGRRFVMDFYTNFAVEGLEYRKEHVTPAVRRAWLDAMRAFLNLQLTMADFVICANERQRDAWLGMMSCLGLVPGAVYDRDNTLESLVAVVPYGIRPEPPVSPSPVLKGVFPGVGRDDTVILWNGGILKWYDPVTLIRATGRVVARRPDVKLLFLGDRYPVAGFDPGATIAEAHAVARELGLLGTNVLFNNGWLPYDDSGRFMVEADIGVSTYYDNLETHFSYRTRLVDFLWSRTPVVCTRGDVIADMVERRGLGIAVPERDVDALTAAIDRLVEDRAFHDRCRANLAAAHDELTWERALRPLIAFCERDRATAGHAAIARDRLWRMPDLTSRTLRYAWARGMERLAVARAPSGR